jgi:hypothetical protein
MPAEIVTVEDLEKFKIRLLADLTKMMQKPEPVVSLLHSAQVWKLLNVSPGTLQKLRVKGILPHTKLLSRINDLLGCGGF